MLLIFCLYFRQLLEDQGILLHLDIHEVGGCLGSYLGSFLEVFWTNAGLISDNTFGLAGQLLGSVGLTNPADYGVFEWESPSDSKEHAKRGQATFYIEQIESKKSSLSPLLVFGCLGRKVQINRTIFIYVQFVPLVIPP